MRNIYMIFEIEGNEENILIVKELYKITGIAKIDHAMVYLFNCYLYIVQNTSKFICQNVNVLCCYLGHI